MKARRWGKIVNISSLAGESGGIKVGADYAASKGGMLALTRKLALEVAPFDVNVNAVAPGTTRTPMIEALPEAGPGGPGWRGFRCGVSAGPRTSPTRSASSRATRPRSSPAPRST